MKTVTIIGSGNVAYHLYKAFSLAENILIQQVVARNKSALETFVSPDKLCTNFEEVVDSDFIIIAVSDNAVEKIAGLLKNFKGIIVHTSGATSLGVLNKHENHGVFYPLQTFSKSREVVFQDIPICIEANTKHNHLELNELACTISGNVQRVNSSQRRQLHMAAVFANNFSNHLFYLGGKICAENQLSFSILKPLIKETVDKLEVLSPYEAQTGPAKRNDQNTLEAHLSILESDLHKDIYTLLSQSLQETYGKKL
ncbi:DUF2520 domain-containing protein [Euzebyella marina]|uniref:DUF2520 domain-containing protein n=1 Tax=Euzebyella marina TaxID=1761453 RepID=A0A3G2L7T4_9FLAO|nr:DUF2520 domain-containing protein [Euzebyella marina]AYN68318.1 DUF2520 domain-containing protein [Euzebyella marina]